MKRLAYQQKAIAKLVSSSVDFLNDKGSFVEVFQAPTGSGKTVMLATALSELVKHEEVTKPLAFIWISINTLHEQSKDSLQAFFSDERLINCISITEIDNKQIQQNEILFVNWDSLNREKNLFIKENEQDWNLSSVIRNTKEEGREIVLIIDESHRSAKTSKASELIEIISPKLTIEVSATPLDVSGDIRIKVNLEDVIQEEMIKSEIIINPGLGEIDNNEDIIDAALSQRKKLAKAYLDESTDINPLLLVQIPNKKYGDVRSPEEQVIDVLKKRDITIENGKLAIWLSSSDNKINLDDIRSNDSAVEVLLFKQAIAQGWDCPRASILLLQREWNTENYTFNIQTLGRIMRMPQQRYYLDHPELNTGYVYTASDNFSIVEDLAKDYVSRVAMLRDEQRYSNISLASQYIRRKREKTRLSGVFRDCLLTASEQFDLPTILNLNKANYQRVIGVEGAVDTIDKTQSIEFKSEASISKTREEISVEYTSFISTQTTPYAKARSTEIIKSSLRTMFKELFNIDDEDVIAGIVINPANKTHISDLIDSAKELYIELPEVEDIVHDVANWQVPSYASVLDPFQEMKNIVKSIMIPYYNKLDKNGKPKMSGPEQKFIGGLESSDDELRWWYKNGERESKFFGIAYERDDGRRYAFYPDFIIKTKKATHIVEIKDDNDFKNENLLKLNAGYEYIKKYDGNDKVYFNILSPIDYDSFFRLLQEQSFEKFKSKYEENLKSVTASRKKIASSDDGPLSQEDRELLEEYDKELTKAVEDKKLLEMSLEQARAVIDSLKYSTGTINSHDVSTTLNIKKPFHIALLGEVTNELDILKELRLYFAKYGLSATEWSLEIFNNNKLQNSDVLNSLKVGQTKYSLVITGQIYHHSGKGNQSANLLTELKNEKYIDHIVGGTPKNQLTPANLVSSLEEYFNTTK